MTLFLTVVHVLVCVFLIVVVLLQRGKGAEIGAVFGGGGGGTLFGSRGAGNFLTRLTTGAAFVFMLTSLSLAYFGGETGTTLFEEDELPAGVADPSPFADPSEAAGDEEAAAEGDGGFAPVPEGEADGGFVEVETAPETDAPAEPAAEAPAADAPAADADSTGSPDASP